MSLISRFANDHAAQTRRARWKRYFELLSLGDNIPPSDLAELGFLLEQLPRTSADVEKDSRALDEFKRLQQVLSEAPQREAQSQSATAANAAFIQEADKIIADLKVKGEALYAAMHRANARQMEAAVATSRIDKLKELNPELLG
jgi:hypothetical protein